MQLSFIPFLIFIRSLFSASVEYDEKRTKTLDICILYTKNICSFFIPFRVIISNDTIAIIEHLSRLKVCKSPLLSIHSVSILYQYNYFITIIGNKII